MQLFQLDSLHVYVHQAWLNTILIGVCVRACMRVFAYGLFQKVSAWGMAGPPPPHPQDILHMKAHYPQDAPKVPPPLLQTPPPEGHTRSRWVTFSME
jgi:hypothetical protein